MKVNFSSEAYSSGEKFLAKRERDSALIEGSGRGRKPLGKFFLNEGRLQSLFVKGYLNEFIEIINATSQTELEGCILTAVYWIGEAQNELDLDVAFLKYWTALECIFSDRVNTTHSLAKGISTAIAFSAYQFIKTEDAQSIYTSVKKLYEKRVNIVHYGMNYLGNEVVSEADVAKICKYAVWSILILFDLRSAGYTTIDEVTSEIDRLYGELTILVLRHLHWK